MSEKNNNSYEDSIGALWKKTSKNGHKYYTGNINMKKLASKFKNADSVPVVVFENKGKQGKQPDLNILIAKLRNE